MKSIKEKQLLVKLAMSLGQQADPSLVKEISSFNSIKQDAHESIKKNALKDLTEAFKRANLEKEAREIIEYPVPPTLDEVLTILKTEEPINELVQPQAKEEPSAREVTISSSESSLAERAAKLISEAPKDSFQQPQPDLVEKSFKDIQSKLKFLEATIGKIAVTGPGSGETKFRMLDDIDRASIGNTDQVLRWRPDPRGDPYGKFFFGQVSGDQGPIRSMLYDRTGYGANANVLPGLTAWNPNKDCLNIHQSDGTILQTGLENYIRIYNSSANILPAGYFVQFAGVNGDAAETPIAIPFVNNANTIPLYAIGVVSANINSNSYGRATTLGEVRNIDTTGNVSGETWQVGDILWAKPNYDERNKGKLTKIKPTAPNVVVSVAAVLKKDSVNGILLVRPVIWPRLYYASFSDTTTQTVANVNYGYPVRFNTTDIDSGFNISANSRIVAENSGLYNFQFSMQVLSTNSSAKDMYVWPRKNGIDIPNSNTKKTVTGNQVADVLSWNFVVSLNENDYFELVWAATATTVRLDAPTQIGFAPNIPSVILTVSEIAL